MDNLTFLQIGRVKKSFGAGGAVRLQVDHSAEGYLEVIKFIFVEIDGIKVPFEVESLESLRPIQIKFSDLNSPEQAHTITGRPIYLATKDLPTDMLEEDFTVEQGDYDMLLGFEIIAVRTGRSIGELIRVEEFPGQDMAFILREGREIMVPLTPEYIADIDAENRQMHMDLPEGLLNL